MKYLGVLAKDGSSPYLVIKASVAVLAGIPFTKNTIYFYIKSQGKIVL